MTDRPVRKTLVVIGDVLLDVDVLTSSSRLTPDAPAPVLVEQERRYRPGGAALAALLAARDPRWQVVLVAPVADDDAAGRLRSLLGEHIELVELPCVGSTSVKTRLRAGGQTVARLDRGTEPVVIRHLPDRARAVLHAASAVLVSDYGDGLTHDEPVRRLLAECLPQVPMVWDPHPRGGVPVPGLTLVTPNLAEVEGAVPAESGEGLGRIRRQADTLVRRWQAHAVAVTLGSRGALLSEGSDSISMFPPPSVADGDTCGAGDCFAAAAAGELAAGGLPSEAVAAGVRAASRFVAGGGVGTLDDPPADKPADDHRSVAQLLAGVRQRGGTVVATGGCFDLLHAGHIATLQAARSLGDCLVVCLNSDDSVRRLKGAGRPLQPAADRATVLQALQCVDAVVVFAEDTPSQLLRELRPDVWVKGGDYSGVELPEEAQLRTWGGQAVTVPYLTGRSTTELMDLARG